MTYFELVDAVKEAYSRADASNIKEHIAFQFNIEGEAEGAFYLEIKDGRIYVEPYEYFDRDVLFTTTAKTLLKIGRGELDPMWAYTTRKLRAEGNLGKALVLKEITPKNVNEETVEAAPAEEKAETETVAPAEETAAETVENTVTTEEKTEAVEQAAAKEAAVQTTEAAENATESTEEEEEEEISAEEIAAEEKDNTPGNSASGAPAGKKRMGRKAKKKRR